MPAGVYKLHGRTSAATTDYNDLQQPMTQRLTPTRLHESLDRRGLLEDSHGPGTYALQVETPDTSGSVAQAFREHVDELPPSEHMAQLADASSVCYVGASGQVYDRLQDHTEGVVRQSLFLRAFEPVSLVGVWPSENAFQDEYNRAVALSRDGWTAWTDGQVI